MPSQKAIIITGVSDELDVIKYTDIEIPTVGADEILIKNKYAGVNYIDTACRKGTWPVAETPCILGAEALGVVTAIGSDVRRFSIGDKVAYIGFNTFAQYTKIKADSICLSKLDKGISERDLKLFGSVLMQTFTALTFVEEAHKVTAGQTILVWAAAGGVGQILIQLIVAKGAHVIAVASTPEKLTLAKSLGAEYLINGLTDDVAAKVQEFTNGNGVDATFDSLGKETFEVSFKSLARKVTFVSYGLVTGKIDPFDLLRLSQSNIKVVWPNFFNYLATSQEWNHYFDQLRELVKAGTLKIDISTYNLSEYAEAARALENRETTGKLTLVIPE